ncbi:unnamed protein product [Callosobruchus maculatus]|uniref:Uncharacterized protein n=1 Tax=Callosobruchus maculatus TaxID=64391 RepID=A0A653CRW3_CALMS|nr:unnamed protein product [Callosobruchus maculatus]
MIPSIVSISNNDATGRSGIFGKLSAGF